MDGLKPVKWENPQEPAYLHAEYAGEEGVVVGLMRMQWAGGLSPPQIPSGKAWMPIPAGPFVEQLPPWALRWLTLGETLIDCSSHFARDVLVLSFDPPVMDVGVSIMRPHRLLNGDRVEFLAVSWGANWERPNMPIGMGSGRGDDPGVCHKIELHVPRQVDPDWPQPVAIRYLMVAAMIVPPGKWIWFGPDALEAQNVVVLGEIQTNKGPGVLPP